MSQHELKGLCIRELRGVAQASIEVVDMLQQGLGGAAGKSPVQVALERHHGIDLRDATGELLRGSIDVGAAFPIGSRNPL
jgi:hypothetical protein